MSTNQSPEFLSAQKKFLMAQTDEEKLLGMEEMIKFMPKHKSAEGLRANIRTRYKKLKEEIEKKKQQRKQTKRKEGIKKEGIQIALIGLTNSGKSSLISILTNTMPKIAPYEFTTKEPIIGMLEYEGINFQIIDLPAINYEAFDQGIANSADILLIIITGMQQINEITPFLEKTSGKKIIAFNKSDLLSDSEKRKIEASLKSKKYNFCIISTKTFGGIEELKQKLLKNSGVIRVYTKQPGMPADKDPMLMKPSSTIKDAAEKILHGFSERIKEVRITGPSSKFPNQKVGLKHVLKDRDIVEFRTE
ncbi:50S ribosome-binding GTPase [Candidatus Pacearchaeota archaeon]|nr:50S ribosome-binding GTPase [Candidatus Pacearchaeota archaeon]